MNINNIYRDKTIDCITEEDVGKSCKAAGWVENIRDHGGVSGHSEKIFSTSSWQVISAL